MPLLEAEQGSPAWHAARLGKVTASNAAACLGVSPWQGRGAAYRAVLGLDLRDTTRAQQWGKDLERKALEDYEEHAGVIIAGTGFWVHPEFEWLGASPDGIVGAAGLVEVKCTSSPPITIPLHYRIQMVVQLAVTGRAWCDLWSWAGPDRSLHRLHRDEVTERRVIDALRSFKEQFIDARLEPPRKRKGDVLFELTPVGA